jgi:dimethylhistidine N-methyltransferase
MAIYRFTTGGGFIVGLTLTFHNHKPVTASLHDAVIKGLSNDPKSIEPKFFYDRRGSELFEMICEQPEYYPPTVEQCLLEEIAADVAKLSGQRCVVIEPGAGSATKIRSLLEALKPAAYIPMDISFDYLKSAATSLVDEFPWLHVHAACVDFTDSLPIPDIVPEGRRLMFFPGSSIGNFEPGDAGAFLSRIRKAIGADGMLLIGVDTKKNESILNAAYNDEAGITAEFNLNLLHRMREELGIECDPTDFDHKAYYNAADGRIEMHLVSKQKQTFELDGHSFSLDAGESIHTENSYKYSPVEFLQLVSNNGFTEVRHWLDQERLFSIFLLRVN